MHGVGNLPYHCETQAGARSNTGTLMFALGFTVMMALDCALG